MISAHHLAFHDDDHIVVIEFFLSGHFKSHYSHLFAVVDVRAIEARTVTVFLD